MIYTMDASLNIVELIENSPIKLSSTYNNRILTKVKSTFDDFEQKLFSSFYCHLNCHPTDDFVIDLDEVWKWLGFGQKDSIKRLLDKHFIIDVDYTSLLRRPSEQTDTTENAVKKSRGGHNKETIMLSVRTFKSLCLKAGTKKADEIHNYYLKLEEIIHQVVQEESDELKQQLENAKIQITKMEETTKTEMDAKVQREREKLLLREFGSSGPIVYIIKVKTNDDGTYILKIGESRIGIQSRYNDHRTNYGENIILLDCFAVKRSKDFESFIHNHEQIRKARVSDLQGHETERELFLIGKSLTYKTVLQIVNSNLKQFNEHNYEKIQAENETLLKIISSMNHPTVQTNIQYENIIQELLKGQQQMMNQIQNLERMNTTILERLNATQTKTTTLFNEPLITLGPKLQQINPESMTIHKVYDSVAECLKESNFKMKRPSIAKAIDENTVYNGYRWAFIDRAADPTILANIPPTRPTQQQNNGYVAKLNADKNEIIAVYIDRKTACKLNGYSISALDTPMKNGTASNGFFYELYEKCSDLLKDEFVEKHGSAPLLYRDGVGQYDLQGNLVQEFVCKYDCIKQLKMSDKSLAKALDNETTYNNHYFKRIGSRLSQGTAE